MLKVEGIDVNIGATPILRGVSLEVPSGTMCGLIGRNGAGKTTFLRMLVSSENPDSGMIELGETVELAYVDQSRDELKGDNTVWQEISNGQDNLEIGKYAVSSRAYASRFNFKGGDQQKFVKDLSNIQFLDKFLVKQDKFQDNTHT